MSSPLAYLIDFDGTLADTSEANYQSYSRALREAGVIVDRKTFDEQAFGRNWREFLPRFLSEGGSSSAAADVAARKVEIYAQAARLVRFNEALIMLVRHRSPLTRVALVTSASSANVNSALAARPDVLALFEVIVTGDDVRQHKPHPEAYELAARKLGVTAEQCIVFEDSEVGVASGLSFGAQVLRVDMSAFVAQAVKGST